MMDFFASRVILMVLIEAVTYRWLTAVQKLLGSRNMED